MIDIDLESITEGDLLLVKWIDPVGNDYGWRGLDEAKDMEASEVSSIGWALGSFKNKIIMAPHQSSPHCWGDVCIPECVIKEVHLIDLDN